MITGQIERSLRIPCWNQPVSLSLSLRDWYCGFRQRPCRRKNWFTI